jgi:hypothetical protein
VKFGEVAKGQRKIYVTADNGEEKEYSIRAHDLSRAERSQTMVSPSRSATPGGELTRSKDSGAKQLAENSTQSPEGTVEILNDTIC